MNLRYAARSSKLALVLAGGGMTGAVYEIGALRAIDDLLVDRSVTDFDIYVGTSAGAIVAAFLANGFSPETMFQVIAGPAPRSSPHQAQVHLQLQPTRIHPAWPWVTGQTAGHRG